MLPKILIIQLMVIVSSVSTWDASPYRIVSKTKKIPDGIIGNADDSKSFLKIGQRRDSTTHYSSRTDRLRNQAILLRRLLNKEAIKPRNTGVLEPQEVNVGNVLAKIRRNIAEMNNLASELNAQQALRQSLDELPGPPISNGFSGQIQSPFDPFEDYVDLTSLDEETFMPTTTTRTTTTTTRSTTRMTTRRPLRTTTIEPPLTSTEIDDMIGYFDAISTLMQTQEQQQMAANRDSRPTCPSTCRCQCGSSVTDRIDLNNLMRNSNNNSNSTANQYSTNRQKVNVNLDLYPCIREARYDLNFALKLCGRQQQNG